MSICESLADYYDGEGVEPMIDAGAELAAFDVLNAALEEDSRCDNIG